MSFDTKNCNLNQLGTGLPDCIEQLGYPKGFIKLDKGFSTAVDTTIDKAFFEEQIQSGVFVPFVGADNNEIPLPEDTIQELANGRSVVARKGKRTMTFGYIVGDYYLNKIFSSYNTNDFGQIALVFENGTVLMCLSQDETEIKGFTTGMFSSNYKPFDGSEVSEVTAQLQLTQPDEFNNRGVIFSADSLGFDPNTLNGVIDAKIDVLTAPAGTEITASVVALFNRAINIEGLTVDDFKLTINGVEDDIATVAYADGVYTITSTTSLVAADKVVLSLFDQTGEFNIILSGDEFYKGVSAEFEVPA